MNKTEILSSLSFGERIAEQEAKELEKYFVQTDLWNRIFKGSVDIVRGPKGAGKSAIYSLLIQKKDDLKKRGIELIPAENPKGMPAFKDIVSHPPVSELEFVNLWKLYLLSLIAEMLRASESNSTKGKQLIEVLENAKLLPREASLAGRLKTVYDYVKLWLRPEAVEGGLNFDSTTGLPNGVTGKITLREPSSKEIDLGYRSINGLLEDADNALKQGNISVWLILDRLDVAFSESQELEKNALRALFKAYLDMQGLEYINLKIFLRDDIWKRITADGFREASHITKDENIYWTPDSLLNLVLKRLLNNAELVTALNVDPDDILNDIEKQREFFYKVFPKQIDPGEKKPTTFDWMLTRTKDSLNDYPMPRELIHLLNESRANELKKLEVGQNGNVVDLISASAIKDALPIVSKVRYEQTLLAEYPDKRTTLEALRGQRTKHTIKTLASLWLLTEEASSAQAQTIVDIGFFVKEGNSGNWTYWVPFLYRSALDMVQGSAD